MATHDALRMSPQELHERIARGERVVLLDVRTKDAISVYPQQIPGSRWLPLASVVEQAASLPRQAIIVCY